MAHLKAAVIVASQGVQGKKKNSCNHISLVCLCCCLSCFLIEVGYLFDSLRANVDKPQEESSGLRIVLVVTVFLYGAQLRLWVPSYFIMFTVVASYG